MKCVGRTSSQSYQTSIIPSEVGSQLWGGLWMYHLWSMQMLSLACDLAGKH